MDLARRETRLDTSVFREIYDIHLWTELVSLPRCVHTSVGRIWRRCQKYVEAFCLAASGTSLKNVNESLKNVNERGWNARRL